jgi:hypothetical protein
MKLVKNEIEKLELKYFDGLSNKFIHIKNKTEHYRLLEYISYLYNDEIFIDAGTFQGHSCTANFYEKLLTTKFN